MEKKNDITEHVKTYGDACVALGMEPMDEDGVECECLRHDEIARRKLETIAEALNEGWEPDWGNTAQPKYYPVFLIQKGEGGAHAGLSFADVSVNGSYASSYTGTWLCFRSVSLARYAGEQFTGLYGEMLLG